MSQASFRPGLAGVIAGKTAIGEVTQTSLRYRGYAIDDLAKHTTFDETAHLLVHGELPTRGQLAEFRTRVQTAMTLPDPVVSAVRAMPDDTPPMDVLRSVASLLGHYDRDAQDLTRPANMRKSERLIGQLAAAVGLWAQKANGVAAVEPDPEASHGANLLTMILGKRPDELAGRVMDGTLILYAEHEFNASTFTARTIASTRSDMHSAVSGAIGALKGPLHGGANEAAMRMFLEIGSPENVEPWFRDIQEHNKAHPESKKLIMGFGHRVYKQGDHRAGILREWSVELSKKTGQSKWIDMADRLQTLMLKEKNIHPNTDYPAAHAYYQLGVPIPFYTPIFVCSRITGWCAHIMEQYDDKKIIRPLSEYAGPGERKVTAIEGR
ncbi:MAG: citrate/2-methylcitrate synthase [Phycisphaerae bacterium]